MLYGNTEDIIVSDMIYKESDIKDGVYGNANTLYLFSDNVVRRGKGGQAVIRDAVNSMGIVTKRYPSNEPKAFLTDEKDYQHVSRLVADDLYEMARKLGEGEYKYIHIPSGGFGTGLAGLKKSAPRIFTMLSELLYVYLDFKNPGMVVW